MLNVLHINKSDLQGGASRATYRLHTGLKALDVNSKMLVDNKISDDPTVYGPMGEISKAWNRVRPYVDRLPLSFYDWQRTPFHPAWVGRNIQRNELNKEANIINLHWINDGLLSLKGVSNLKKLRKPIVWTLHDMWPFTGGCHYSGGCEKYIVSCGACPQLNSKRDNDISRKIWRRKRSALKDLDLTLVSPSMWLAECARNSSLFADSRIEVIPHALNPSIFKPIVKSIARNILNLPKNKNIILFGALGANNFRIKGLNYLIKSLSILEKINVFKKEKLCLVIFGAAHSEDIGHLPYEVRFLGRLYDDFSLALAYNGADVFVAPSLQEAFGQTYLESMSCGTPCVAFDYSGPKDIIDHKKNGYLAEYRDSQSLAEGIQWVLEDESRILKLGEAARKKAVKEFALEIQAKRYLSLYEKLLNKDGNK